MYGLAETSSSGGLGSVTALVPMLVGLALIGGFIANALRTRWALIDVRLWRNAVMRASSAATFLLPAAMFGAMLLMPLYYQVVRGESALHAGLLLAPQGLGAALAMPFAGKVTDNYGAGRIVLVGVALLAAGMIGFTQIGAGSSYWALGSFQFVLGLGMGSSMMPSMAAAYQTMRHEQVARATTALNIIMRVGGAVGTALLSVVLTHQLAGRLPGGSEGGLGAAQSVPPAARERIAPTVAEAFGHTFWWSVGLVAIALVPVLFLPRRKPAPPQTAPVGADEAARETVAA